MVAQVASSSSSRPDAWRPERYLDPPAPDVEEVNEQASYQAAITRPAGDLRGAKKFKPRRTVDYNGGVGRWRNVGVNGNKSDEQFNKLKSIPNFYPSIHPNPSHLVGVSIT
jgi:polyadenylation factor subunit 2